jgi:hypothetical protein
MSASSPEKSPPSTTASSDKKEWKLDESSLWWLSLGVFQNPGNVLLISSVPFCVGAYFGYRKPTEKMEKLVGSFGTENSEEAQKFGTEAERRLLGIRTAGRALRLGTLGSVGTMGILSASELEHWALVGTLISNRQTAEEHKLTESFLPFYHLLQHFSMPLGSEPWTKL